ncbi:hypothetical protein HELRODRAFT_62844, partial [Helobdella robusta]|uniref:Uncharacterized protein n=1 Tax=Helobdella robusta TaxID=6412 RepID=T1FX60_HELRO
GQMSVTYLEQKVASSLAAGNSQFFVLTNSGSAMLGFFDSLTEIADVCYKYNLWLHVDLNNTLIIIIITKMTMTPTMTSELKWNCHMRMNCTLQCYAIFIRKKEGTKIQDLLEACNSACATYLFQQDKHHGLRCDLRHWP